MQDAEEVRYNEALSTLRSLWVSTQSPKVRDSLQEVALTLEELAGALDFLDSETLISTQQDWRDLILSY